MTSVLFVCTGNICRSPTAEGILRHLAEHRGLVDMEIDSAGMIDYHTGEKPDPRSREMAASRGILTLETQHARQICPADFDTFDHILAMDRGHLKQLQALADYPRDEKVTLFLSYLDGDSGRDVPDPYYGGPEGFANVFDLIYAGCEAFLDHLEER